MWKECLQHFFRKLILLLQQPTREANEKQSGLEKVAASIQWTETDFMVCSGLIDHVNILSFWPEPINDITYWFVSKGLNIQ